MRIRAFASAILEHVPEHAKILEVGCGEGELTQSLREAGCDVTPLDPKLRAPFDVYALRFEDFEAPALSFDCIAAQLVLHHTDDLTVFLNKAATLLRADGVLAIDDYGWERPCEEIGEEWRRERQDLHTSQAMLLALRKRFTAIHYADHAYFDEGAGHDSLGFTFIGKPVCIGGREPRKLVIHDYDATWPKRFERERARIEQALGPAARRIEHIGSTSVPGLAAKPIVDILVEVDDPHDESIRRALELAGYEFRVHEPGHRMFRTRERDVHVHLWTAGSKDVNRHIDFRDRLRTSAQARRAYEAVKRELARRDWEDMNDYAEAKSEIIDRIMSELAPS